MNIILTGMPACGKSAVARILGELLNAEVIDTDVEIEKAYGGIAEIFKKYGEEKFRSIESEVIKNACKKKNVIISSGGGSVLRSENTDNFKACGKIVYLKAEVKTLLARLGNNSERPLLLGGAEKRLKELFAERKQIYDQTADITVETDSLTPQEVADAILKSII